MLADLADRYGNRSVLRCRLLRVTDHVLQHLQQPLAVHDDLDAAIADLERRPGCGVRATPHRFGANLIEIGAVRLLLGEHTIAQLVHQAGHSLHRVVDRQDRIVEELRIAAMTRGVLHNERLLRDEMPQVVHDDRGHAAHRLELMRLGKAFGRLLEGKEARHLAAGGAQQIDLFPGQRRLRERMRDGHEADQRALRK